MTCTIISNSTSARTYDVKTRSAYKAAQKYGRAEGGEIVTISTKSGKIVSMAMWTPEDGGHYYRATV